MKNPLELSKRLARRRMKTLRKPPRAWCLAVRASDTRMNVLNAHMTQRPERRIEHDLTLTTPLLREICAPVRFTTWGYSRREAAKVLGMTPESLETAIKAKVFRFEWKPFGKYGRVERLLYANRPLFDPAGGSFKAPPDPVWGSLWESLSNMVPEDLKQTVTRVPYIQPQRCVFNGWRWICPACRKKVRLLFYPVAPLNLPGYFNFDRKLREIAGGGELDEIEKPVPSFACVKCHGVQYFYRVGPNAWNMLIHYLSGGLLYGYEVKRPAWVGHDRKRKFKALIGRAPSQRRAEVLERLLRGWTDRKIAKDLGISYHRTRNLVTRVLKEHRAHSRRELIAICGSGVSAERARRPLAKEAMTSPRQPAHPSQSAALHVVGG